MALSVVAPKRLGLPHEFALLASQMIENSYMNGETIRLDAGIRVCLLFEISRDKLLTYFALDGLFQQNLEKISFSLSNNLRHRLYNYIYV